MKCDLWYLNGARYYDPVLRRFITPDTVISDLYNPQNLNRYSYCLNNPLIYVDPSGHDAYESLVFFDIAHNALYDSPAVDWTQLTPSENLTLEILNAPHTIMVDKMGMSESTYEATMAASFLLQPEIALAAKSLSFLATSARIALEAKAAEWLLDGGKYLANETGSLKLGGKISPNDFVHVAPKAAEASIANNGITAGTDGYVYLTKEKHLEGVKVSDLSKTLYRKDLQPLVSNRFNEGALKVQVSDINPRYYNRTTTNGVPQWRYKGDIPADKLKIWEY